MQTMESLIALLGSPIDSEPVKTLISSECLQSLTDEDLEEGEPVRSHLIGYSGGYSFSYTRGRLDTLFIHVRPIREYAAFRGTLMYGLTCKSIRAEVMQKLGTPTRSGEARRHPPVGRYGPWDRFDSPLLCLHFQFTRVEEEIDLITAMMPDIAP